MTGLDNWLKQATCNLAAASAAQVRREIQEHYELAREAAIAGGATAEFAAASALKALGAAKTANRQYRRVLLTSGEARSLRGGEFEARAVCSRPWLRWMLPALPLAGLAVAAALFFTGHVSAARDALIIAIGMSPALTGPVLPIYTPIRSRVFPGCEVVRDNGGASDRSAGRRPVVLAAVLQFMDHRLDRTDARLDPPETAGGGMA
jgi:hypothetical protein